MRTASEQLARLLGDKGEGASKKSFYMFANVNPLHYNPYTEPQWRAKMDEWEQNVERSAQSIMPQLRAKFKSGSYSSLQVLLGRKQLAKRSYGTFH